ncbi:uncharacterized protein [Macrobrachium rosenbergii]|uniref:uncharacterized protein isoform X2 n=1 Tax=Macrobrachium rosenbergii TaxID=79674 RepID=UPI0034D50D07
MDRLLFFILLVNSSLASRINTWDPTSPTAPTWPTPPPTTWYPTPPPTERPSTPPSTRWYPTPTPPTWGPTQSPTPPTTEGPSTPPPTRWHPTPTPTWGPTPPTTERQSTPPPTRWYPTPTPTWGPTPPTTERPSTPPPTRWYPTPTPTWGSTPPTTERPSTPPPTRWYPTPTWGSTPPTTERPSTPLPISTSTESACQHPFEKIGGQCLMVENFSIGTYHGMAEFCDLLGGHIVKIPDADSLYHITDYLYSNQLTTLSFWIGATDEAAEGSWKWEDGSSVLMRTPFWANHGCSNEQAPEGGEKENCAVLDEKLHFYFNDVPCDSEFGVICEAAW